MTRIERTEASAEIVRIVREGIANVSELVAVANADPDAFKRADRDGNQKLTLYEFLYVIHRDFDAADKNQDGVIDMQELRVLVGK